MAKLWPNSAEFGRIVASRHVDGHSEHDRGSTAYAQGVWECAVAISAPASGSASLFCPDHNSIVAMPSSLGVAAISFGLSAEAPKSDLRADAPPPQLEGVLPQLVPPHPQAEREDLSDRSQLVRASALRAMASIKVLEVIQLVMVAVRTGTGRVQLGVSVA